MNFLSAQNDPGHERDYPCLMFALVAGGKPFTSAILHPAVIRVQGIITHRFVFGGFIWAFLVASHRVPPTQVLPIVRAAGEMVFMEGEAMEIEDIPKFFAARMRGQLG